MRKISIICGGCHNLPDRNNYSSNVTTLNHQEIWIKTHPSVQSSLINAYEKGAKRRNQYTLRWAMEHMLRQQAPVTMALRQEGINLLFLSVLRKSYIRYTVNLSKAMLCLPMIHQIIDANSPTFLTETQSIQKQKHKLPQHELTTLFLGQEKTTHLQITDIAYL